MTTRVESDIEWPGGACWTIGVLKHSPEQLASSPIPIIFTDGSDGLDEYAVAAVFDQQISQLLLVRHLHSPADGTEVMIDVGVSRREGLLAVARCLHLDIRDFEWVTPYASFEAAQADRPSLIPGSEQRDSLTNVAAPLLSGAAAARVRRRKYIFSATTNSNARQKPLRARRPQRISPDNAPTGTQT